MIERYPGKMVVLEGIDGCGKTTIAKNLTENQDGWVHQASPSWEGTGAKVRDILMGKAPNPGAWTLQMMFALDRYEVVQRTLLPDLRAGKTVICDRWWYSGLMYGKYDGLLMDDVEALYRYLTVVPDLVLHLGVTPLVAVQREGKGSGKDLYDGDIARQTKLAELYQDNLESYHYEEWLRREQDHFEATGGTSGAYVRPSVINADRPIEAVQADVLAAITKVRSP